ncbi:MAG: hypothetical protein ABSC01_14725 [Verrucomicrobiota bacterium]|jgi:hypothetical protein
MPAPDFDPSKLANKWVAYFDLLGFKQHVKRRGLIDAFGLLGWCSDELEYHAREFKNVNLVSFSDTFLLYTSDDSRASFQAITDVSRSFFDELVLAGIPVRGALAFGELYADETNNLFLGEALIDAYEYGEKFDWLGFVLHPSSLKRMSEVGQPVSQLYYKKCLVECKNRETNVVKKKRVVAYKVGPGSIMPVTGGNPYLTTAKQMRDSTKSKKHRKKYQNTMQLLKS